MRVCLVYDHVFPQTVGGAERWMRDLALALAGAGHEPTYLTLRHPGATRPEIAGVRVLELAEARRVYGEGRRTLGPPFRFGLAVARHLARHGREYDVIHLASFPYFPLLAAGALRRRARYALVVDWHEVWTRGYWQHYAGRATGIAGWLVQKACLRIPHTAHCMSALNAGRLVAEGYRGEPTVLPGLYAGPVEPTQGDLVDPDLVVYAGRHIPEKRVGALVRAVALAQGERPGIRLEVYGDGPALEPVETLVRALELGDTVAFHGRQPEEKIAAALSRAACVATASEREGYGLVVVEAAARGTPSVVVAGPENAATELVREGVNGAVAPDPSPDALASALLRVLGAGSALRASTAAWFAVNAPRLKIERSIELVLAEYARTPDA